MLIAIVENSQVVRSGAVHAIFPNSVFGSAGPDAAWLASQNAYVVQMSKNHDSGKQRLIETDPYYENGVVYGVQVQDFSESDALLAFDQKWESVRVHRNMLFNKMQWRVDRYHREQRLGITPTTDDITALDTYFHQLAEVTKQPDPNNITWPNPPL